MYNVVQQEDMEPEEAASTIQRMFRGFASRRRAREDREEELVFIGMKAPPEAESKELDKEAEEARQRRKEIQVRFTRARTRVCVGAFVWVCMCVYM